MKTTVRQLLETIEKENTSDIIDYVLVDVYDGDKSDVIDIEIDHETKEVRLCIN